MKKNGERTTWRKEKEKMEKGNGTVRNWKMPIILMITSNVSTGIRVVLYNLNQKHMLLI